MPVKDHASRAEPAAAAREVVAEPPETWARTRPFPAAMRYVLAGSNGAGAGAGADEPMETLTYSAEEPPEQPKEQ